jgi:hypothetical protein
MEVTFQVQPADLSYRVRSEPLHSGPKLCYWQFGASLNTEVLAQWLSILEGPGKPRLRGRCLFGPTFQLRHPASWRPSHKGRPFQLPTHATSHLSSLSKVIIGPLAKLNPSRAPSSQSWTLFSQLSLAAWVLWPCRIQLSVSSLASCNAS